MGKQTSSIVTRGGGTYVKGVSNSKGGDGRVRINGMFKREEGENYRSCGSELGVSRRKNRPHLLKRGEKPVSGIGRLVKERHAIRGEIPGEVMSKREKSH